MNQTDCPPQYWSPILNKCMIDPYTDPDDEIPPGYCDPGTTTGAIRG